MEEQQITQTRDSLPRDNHGYIVRCQKRHERSPDMTGECWINSRRFQVAGWVTTSKRGRKYLNLRFIPVEKNGGKA